MRESATKARGRSPKIERGINPKWKVLYLVHTACPNISVPDNKSSARPLKN